MGAAAGAPTRNRQPDGGEGLPPPPGTKRTVPSSADAGMVLKKAKENVETRQESATKTSDAAGAPPMPDRKRPPAITTERPLKKKAATFEGPASPQTPPTAILSPRSGFGSARAASCGSHGESPWKRASFCTA